jgi:hypothetical protein
VSSSEHVVVIELRDNQLQGDGVEVEMLKTESDRWRRCRGEQRETKKNSYGKVLCSLIRDDSWMLIATALVCIGDSIPD